MNAKITERHQASCHEPPTVASDEVQTFQTSRRVLRKRRRSALAPSPTARRHRPQGSSTRPSQRRGLQDWRWPKSQRAASGGVPATKVVRHLRARGQTSRWLSFGDEGQE